jgi:hypothetical protein
MRPWLAVLASATLVLAVLSPDHSRGNPACIAFCVAEYANAVATCDGNPTCLEQAQQAEIACIQGCSDPRTDLPTAQRHGGSAHP